jgi:hypothetical protein
MFHHLAIKNLVLLYADPGSGALIWQLLVAAFIGSMFYFRRIKDWLFLKRKVRGSEPPSPPALPDEDKSKS